jgi:hypothetical protein
MLSMLSIPVTFKEVYTSNSRSFHANPSWTITQFIDSVKPHISREFNVLEDNLEIIEAGQYAPGIKPEAAAPLTQDTTKMKHKWGKKLNVSFYIRRKDYAYPQSNVNLIRQTVATTSIIDDCPICFETLTLSSRHTCSHAICDRCHQHCLSTNYTICPVCRQI